ncbi:hypothetical protein RAS1_12520 [Phycisphaerae bacterium RAS1]|nr:hypothetical protein RAS1_12520 [Phycisphaerae bacterium RAS1]
MTIEKLRGVVQSKPFRPFYLCLADGRQIRVPSPEYIFVQPEAQRTIYVAGSGEEGHWIDLLLVTSVTYTNGRSRRSRG